MRVTEGKMAAGMSGQAGFRFGVALAALALGTAARAEGPSFDCSKVAAGSVPARVCADPGLAALDRSLAAAYAAARGKAGNERPAMLKAEQRGWVKGRDDCWKAADIDACIRDAYVQRTVELQARYRLVAANGPHRFACNGNPADELIVTHFATTPPSLIAERGDQSSLMTAQPAASGTRYAGRNESYREHQGEARVVWGYGAAEMLCRLQH